MVEDADATEGADAEALPLAPRPATAGVAGTWGPGALESLEVIWSVLESPEEPGGVKPV